MMCSNRTDKKFYLYTAIGELYMVGCAKSRPTKVFAQFSVLFPVSDFRISGLQQPLFVSIPTTFLGPTHYILGSFFSHVGLFTVGQPSVDATHPSRFRFVKIEILVAVENATYAGAKS
jgi:hypothetical protein